MKHIGIDYGTKKVGIAVSDIEGRMAFPKVILPNTKDLVAAVAEIATSEGAGFVVIGESLDFSGMANDLMSDIRRFSDALAEATGLPVAFQKEFMTSVEARRPLDGKKALVARKTKEAKQGNVDASAAALILQRYLDVNRK